MLEVSQQKCIGIITLSASDNCGSLLQAFALQDVLENKLHCKVEIINLRTKQSANVYNIFSHDFYKHPRKTLVTIINIKSILHQRRNYADFRKQYLNMSVKTYRSLHDLELLENDYNVIVTGSDQVWNASMTDFHDAFFIPWKTSARKVAYAVSLGSLQKYNAKKEGDVRKWLKDFDMISVRELTGRQVIESLTNETVEVLADPTLLIEHRSWKLLAGERMISGEYIFYYSWAYSDINMNRLVQRFATERKLDVYVINSSKWCRFRPRKFGFSLCKESGPIAFVNLMLYAKYVFVQSFHGVVFSNILRKRFFFLNERTDGSIDCRTDSIIKVLHEEGQVVHSWDDIEKAMNTRLKYTSKEYLLLIEKSLEYIDSIGKLL